MHRDAQSRTAGRSGAAWATYAPLDRAGSGVRPRAYGSSPSAVLKVISSTSTGSLRTSLTP
jgi:hypothetical protein